MAISMLDFSRFKFISFDCYGTLIDWETGLLKALAPILHKHGVQVSDAELLQLYGDFEAEAESGAYRSYRDVLRDVVRRLAQRLGFEASTAEQDSLPNSIASWEPFPDTVRALKELHSRYKLAILSNIDDDLFAATAPRLGINFDQVITASQASAYKPSPVIFRLAQQRLGISAPEWLHAGQSIYHDIVPAQSMGLATVWVNRQSRRHGVGAVRAASATPDLEVHGLEELAAKARNL